MDALHGTPQNLPKSIAVSKLTTDLNYSKFPPIHSLYSSISSSTQFKQTEDNVRRFRES